MIDLSRISEDERNLLAEVAKAKGQTLEEALISLGHVPPPRQDIKLEDTKVEFVGVNIVEDTTESTPMVLEPPLQVQRENNAAIEDAVPSLPSDFAISEPPMAADTEPEADKPDDGQLGSALHICPQCGWDCNMPVIEDPSHTDKLGFLHMLLGQKVFTKRYLLYSGHLRVSLRSLTLREIDVLYQETFKAQKMGVIATDHDYYEYLNRLRLYLQLTSLSAQQSALHITLPDGLTKETHPTAESFWDVFLKEKGCYKEETDNGPSLIDQIKDYVLSNVLCTEHLHRIVSNTCSKFNRLVVKLEVCVDDPNFMNEIEQPS